ncbi:hypothetical protein P20652_4120 [Pseudoalteromonas sp. BSi20652]|uniref:hypothetical protein n=1 Tax=Pseudoalteromonas sp. BSi20652 TaxID=388384 RepID=UPI0002316B4D|nr:hypothetical protein [Pseudoalteromonas sp. BSi20652]GAA62216.1 hypothetical protein P20652_4120 [Pseudoalteromonas sp. BSi20652]
MQNTTVFNVLICLLLILIGTIIDEIPSILSGGYTALLDIINTHFKPFFFILATYLTIRLGLKKFGNEVLATCTITSEYFKPDYISSVVLTNCKDKPLVIKSILAEFKGNSHLELIKFKEPLVISAHSSNKVKIPPYSKLSLNGCEYTPDLLDITIILQSDSEYIKCKEPNIKKGLSSVQITKSSRKFNGFIYNESLKYALLYSENDKTYTAFIAANGFLGNEWGYGQCLVAKNGGGNVSNIRQMLKENSIKEWVLYDLNKSNGGRVIASSSNE